jgi:ankyrin repeat protein
MKNDHKERCVKQLLAAAGTACVVAAYALTLSADGSAGTLIEFARRGDVEHVRALLRRGAKVDDRTPDGMTALHWAVFRDDETMARLLLNAGAKADVPSKYGVTPLGLASENRNAVVTKLLLEHGAAADAEPSGEAALHIAARAGALDVVHALLAHGATVDIRETWQSTTPLMVAAAERHADVVKALVTAGADVNAKAAETELFIGPGDESTTYTQIPRGGMTPLMFAARSGCADCIATLAAAGANVNYQDRARVTPLNLAIHNGEYDAAAMLLDKGANSNDGSVFLTVDMRNLVADGVNADHHPVPRHQTRVDSLTILRRLLAAGASPDEDLRKELQARSLGFNRPVYLSGLTPLQRASEQADLAAMRALLEAGADPNLATDAVFGGALGPTGNGGETPLMFAIRSYSGVPASILGNRPGKLAYRVREPGDSLKAVSMLLDAGADVRAADWSGNTVIHVAAQVSAPEIIELLASRGANLVARNEANQTALDALTNPIGGRGGGRGRGGPNPAATATAALLRRLMGLPAEPTPAPGGPASRGAQ